MLEVMQFVMSSFWVWLGTFVLFYVFMEGLRRIIETLTAYYQFSKGDEE